MVVPRKEEARSESDPFPISNIRAGQLEQVGAEQCSSGSAMTLTERLLHETVNQQSELSKFRRTQRGGRLPGGLGGPTYLKRKFVSDDLVLEKWHHPQWSTDVEPYYQSRYNCF
jgi:hypothetical protein